MFHAQSGCKPFPVMNRIFESGGIPRTSVDCQENLTENRVFVSSVSLGKFVRLLSHNSLVWSCPPMDLATSARARIGTLLGESVPRPNLVYQENVYAWKFLSVIWRR
jgi:hypothetical protein